MKWKNTGFNRVAFFLQHMGFHSDPPLPQIPDSFSGHQRIGIVRTHEDSPDASLYNGLHAWWLLSVVAAGLQRYIQVCTLGRFHTGFQSIPFRMTFAVSGVISFANYPSILHNHSAHQRIGAGPALSLFRQFDGPAHIILIYQDFIPPF